MFSPSSAESLRNPSARQESEARLAQARTELAAEVEKAKMELQVTCRALAGEISNSLLGGAPADGSRRAN